MQRLRRGSLLCTALTLSTALAGCAVPSSASSFTTTGSVLTYGHQQEPPCVYGGWIEQGYLSHQILDGLVALDDDGSIVAWLAQDWSESDDHLTWTFTLQSDPTFSDGTPVDAHAVVENFEYWLDGGNGTALVWLSGYVESVRASDATTVEISLSRPYPRLAENLTQPYFGLQSPTALRTRSTEENCTAPIGSGPFTVTEWTRGQNIILDRRDDYDWAPAHSSDPGAAGVERVDWRFIADPSARTAALRAGDVDAIYDVQAFEWDDLAEEGFTTHHYVTPGRPQQLTFNTTRPPFDDKQVRQALAHSVDRKSIVDTVGRGVIPYEGNGAVSSATPGYSAEAAAHYSYDPAQAVRLLEKAGWHEGDDGIRVKDGHRLSVTLPYAANRTVNQDGSAILQGLAAQAEEVGFDIELIPVPPSAAAAGAYSGRDDYDVSTGYWTSVNAGILHVTWRQDLPDAPNPSNAAFYNDPELEELIVTANSATDPDEQDALYQAAQTRIAEEALSIGLYPRLSTLAVAPEVQGVKQENSQGGPVFYAAHITD